MADKKALFAGRTGEKTSKSSTASKKSLQQTTSPQGSITPAASSTEKKSPLSFSRKGGAGARGVAVTAQRRELQIKEAEDARKQANKCLQKTMTRWNPDFFSAAPLFEKAGACYRTAGEDGKATEMYIQAGECQSHQSVLAHASAAKDFREAALITERQGSEEEAAALHLRCAEAWVSGDEPGRAADYLGRSARLIEATDEEAAAERYILASEVMVPAGSDDKTNFVKVVGGCDVLEQGIRFLASTGRLDECIQVVERYSIILFAEGIQHSLARMYLSFCVLSLSLGDHVRAAAAFKDVHLQSTAYLKSEECRVEEELLISFRDYRADSLAEVQRDRTLRRLEAPIVRLALSLRVPGDDEQDVIPAAQKPSGTVGDARTRLGALKEKYSGGGSGGGATSSTAASASPSPCLTPPPPPPPRQLTSASAAAASASSSPPPPPPGPAKMSSEMREAATRGPGAIGPAPGEGSGDSARGALFGTAAAAAAALPRFEPKKEPLVPVTAGFDGRAEALGSDGEADDDVVDLGLGDLEGVIGGVGDDGRGGGGGGGVDDDGDDLEAMIEASRREAEALGLGRGEGAQEESDEEEEEEDIDLT